MTEPASHPESPTTIGFLLLPHFSLLGFSAALEPLRLANMRSDRLLYRWVILSPDGGPVASSSDMVSVADRSMTDLNGIDVLFVCASWHAEHATSPSVVTVVRRAERIGIAIGGIETGSYALAKAGVLNGYQATIHWEDLDTLTELYPRILVKRDLYVIDRNRYTAAGATAALDMMLHLIAVDHGDRFANQLAEAFTHTQRRHADTPQRMTVERRFQGNSRRLSKAVEQMENALEDPLPLEDIASEAGISLRELERLFKRWLHTTPNAYYRELRLLRARSLLQSTALPVTEIAVSCGFTSPAHFSRCFRTRFRRSPSEERGR